MPNEASRRVTKRLLIAGFTLLTAVGCAHATASGSVSSDVSGAPSATPSSISTADAAPRPGAPAWCQTLDNPAVTTLSNVLPELVTNTAATAVPKVHDAAIVLRHAAASAPSEPKQLLTVAAGSLDSAADAKSAASLKDVGSAFSALSKGVQGTCGFH